MSNSPNPPAPASGQADGGAVAPAKPLLFDLSGIDLKRVVHDRAAIAKMNPHRDHLALLDAIVWEQPDFKRGIGVWHVKPTEFWVSGHFPGKPMLPGVLQVEAAAQLGVFLFNRRFPAPRLCAFTHINDVAFRSQVVPGDDLYLLCDEIRASNRRFQSRSMGVVNGKIAFEAEIAGIAI